jgi:hypothetical protein
MHALIGHLVRWRLRYALATLLLLLVSSTQVAHMAFNGDINVMFDRDDPYRIRLQELESTYQQAQFLLILVKPPNGAVFTPDSIGLIRDLTERAAQLPHAVRVDSVTRFPHVVVDRDSLVIEDAIDTAVDITPQQVARLRALSLADARIRGRLVSEAGDVAALLVTLALPDNHLQGILAVERAANDLRENFQARFPGTEMHFNGDVAIENAILDVTLDDMLRVNPLVFGTIFVLTGVFLRSLMAIAATIAVVATSVGITMGLLIRLGFDVNPITMMAPAIIMVLAVADSIHILTQYVLLLRQGIAAETAMIRSLIHNARPVFWTSFTTAIGFLGMNFGDSPPFRDMGNMAAVGVLFALLCTYTVLPTVVLLFRQQRLPKPLALTEPLQRLAGWLVRAPLLSMWAMLAVVTFLLLQIPRLQVNDDLAHYFDESLEIQRAIQFTRQHVQGVEFILYSLDAGEAGQVNDPAFLRKVDHFSAWLRQQPEVAGVDSYADLVKSLHQIMNADDPAFYRIPDQRELVAQYLLLYELALPQGMDLTRDLNADRSALRLVVNLVASENQTLLGIEQRADAWLQQTYPELRSRPTSQLLMFAHLGTSIILSMVDGSLFTLLFVTGMMVIGLRSWRYGLLSMIPNVCPPAVIYGIWALTAGQVNHAAAMTFCISLGLVVDDTIHLMSKFLDGRRAGLSAEASVTAALLSSGTAVVITSLTLIAGILLLSLSHFTVNDTMSLMLAGIILAALVFDLVFLPLLLLATDRLWKWAPVSSPQADTSILKEG